MTKFIDDIRKQPFQLLQSLDLTISEGWAEMEKAVALIRAAKTLYITGIGASWNAGLAIQDAFNESGVAAILCDSSEFFHFTRLKADSTVIFLSRSGKSIEVVNSLEKCRAAGAHVISITNDSDSILARKSDICLLTQVEFDNSISVSTYTSIILKGQLLASALSGAFSKAVIHKSLSISFNEINKKLPRWEEILNDSDWIDKNNYTYFLARGGSLASAFESMLIWEEGAKQPASAMTTGSFRHGPQEIIAGNVNIGLWIDNEKAREYDFKLVNDLHAQGKKLITIGCSLPAGLKGLKIDLPEIPYLFQPVINIFPMQLAAEKLSRLKGEDCDRFRFCNFIVEHEGGLNS